MRYKHREANREDDSRCDTVEQKELCPGRLEPSLSKRRFHQKPGERGDDERGEEQDQLCARIEHRIVGKHAAAPPEDDERPVPEIERVGDKAYEDCGPE